MQEVLRLRLRRRRWKIPGLLLVLKTGRLVRTIAKGLARGMTATAKGDCRAAGKAVRFAVHVEELNFPFDAQGAVIADSYFCRWHSSSRLTEKTSLRPKRLRKNSKTVIPRAGFARGICFFPSFAKKKIPRVARDDN
jgi:hypothetical protein